MAEPQTLSELQENFSLPGALSFHENEAGLVFARVAAPSCTGELYLQGAHVTAWQPTAPGESGQPVLFLSPNSAFVPGKAIRGGVPVIFPWFGDRSAAMGAREGLQSPAHGFARTALWRLAFAALAGDDLHLTLTLEPDEHTRALGYDGFRVGYEVVFGEALTLRMTVANAGTAPLHYEQAMHTYLAVSDVEGIRLIGLNDTGYLDKTDGFRRKRQTEATLTLTGETDRVYQQTMTTVKAEDPAYGRSLLVTKGASHSTVVWNPWAEQAAKLADLGATEWKHMVCVETANLGECAVTLPPGGASIMTARLAVERS